jgi:hypothetical protein
MCRNLVEFCIDFLKNFQLHIGTFNLTRVPSSSLMRLEFRDNLIDEFGIAATSERDTPKKKYKVDKPQVY